jgi:predicted membrane-bound mannosyltransferase
MLAGDRAKTERLTRIFQDRVAAAIEANFNVAAEDEKVRRLRKALIENAAARDGELFLYALLTVMNRMTAPWQLIRLGVKAAGSDTAARVADTNYGVAVNIVLAELERMVAELRDDLRSGQGIAVDRF